jgi:hypothetical protein
LIVIPNKRSLRSEESGRAARRVAFFATQEPRVWLASFIKLHRYRKSFPKDFKGVFTVTVARHRLSSRPELLIPEGDEKRSGGTRCFVQPTATLKSSGKTKGASQKACAKLNLYFHPSRFRGVNVPFFQIYFVR